MNLPNVHLTEEERATLLELVKRALRDEAPVPESRWDHLKDIETKLS